MKKGMIFDLYQDGCTTRRVVCLDNNKARCLDTGEIITDIDFENEVGSVIIENILTFEPIQ